MNLNEIIAKKLEMIAVENKILGDRGHYYGFMNASTAFMTLDDLTPEQVLNKDYKAKYIGESIKNHVLEIIKDPEFSDEIKTSLGYNFNNPHKHYTKRTLVMNKIESLINYFNQNSIDFTIAGSYRREKFYVGDIDIILTDKMMPKSDFSNFSDVVAYGDKKAKLVFSDLEVDIRSVKPEHFPCTLQYYTGSRDHNKMVRGVYKSKGFKLNEYNITNRKTGEIIYPKDEKEIYDFVGLKYISPILR